MLAGLIVLLVFCLSFGVGIALYFQHELKKRGLNPKLEPWPIIALSLLSALAIEGVWYGFSYGFSWINWTIAIVLTWYKGLGISVGYHRGFTHETFQFREQQILPKVLAAGAGLQGLGAEKWVADHNAHHRFEDGPDDPHSPRWLFHGWLRGFLWAHFVWFFFKYDPPAECRIIRDPVIAKTIAWEKRWHAWFFPAGFLVPVLICGLHGSFQGGRYGFFWGGTESILLSSVQTMYIFHVIWSVNSVCHMLGSRVNPKSQGRNLWPWFVHLPALVGELYHGNHHNNPMRYKLGLRWYDIDSGKWCINILKFFKLVEIKSQQSINKAA